MEADRPPVVINLLGPTPPRNMQWCAICAMLYLGEVSADPQVQEEARELVAKAMENGKTFVEMVLPRHPWRTLTVAVAVAPTVHGFTGSTCWVHMQGMKPQGSGNPSGLIPGKDIPT